MRRTIRHSPVDAGVYPRPFPHERGEEPQLVHGTASFAPNTAPWKPCLLTGAFDQCVAELLDLRRDTLQKIRPVGGFGHRIGVESSLGGFGGSIDIGRRSLAKHRIQARTLYRIPGAEAFCILAVRPACNKMFTVKSHDGGNFSA